MLIGSERGKHLATVGVSRLSVMTVLSLPTRAPALTNAGARVGLIKAGLITLRLLITGTLAVKHPLEDDDTYFLQSGRDSPF